MKNLILVFIAIFLIGCNSKKEIVDNLKDMKGYLPCEHMDVHGQMNLEKTGKFVNVFELDENDNVILSNVYKMKKGKKYELIIDNVIYAEYLNGSSVVYMGVGSRLMARVEMLKSLSGVVNSLESLWVAVDQGKLKGNMWLSSHGLNGGLEETLKGFNSEITDLSIRRADAYTKAIMNNAKNDDVKFSPVILGMEIKDKLTDNKIEVGFYNSLSKRIE